MALIRRSSPFADFVMLRDAMDRLFDETLFRPIRAGNGKHETVPALDLYTTADAVIAEVALPGVKPEDVDISLADDLVTITGSFKEEKETTEPGYVHKELSRGTFSRSFTIPTAIKTDLVKATFKDGLLTLVLPKAEQVMPKHVKVEVS